MKDEGGRRQRERSSQRAPSCPSRLPGAQPCCGRATIPMSHHGDKVPKPHAGPGGARWGQRPGDRDLQAVPLRTGWCHESAAKQQPRCPEDELGAGGRGPVTQAWGLRVGTPVGAGRAWVVGASPRCY